ncbi:hypothetical protein GCM10009828_070390 [Actinoplanes couchii]|uniref:Pyrrolo-quinoline quinone repeat domain-containing protein n=2 Tax=Actinoplanes couchii TaxID=403638 RepID=A0ABQ3X5W7_9ACTN|nr:hypothetical protein Aco03nite_023080 [Actinoplanes couchii]
MIELGDVSGEPDGDGRAERVPEFRHGTVRRLVLAGLAALCVVALGGSARPAPPLIQELWAVPFEEMDSMSVAGGLILVQTNSDGSPSLTAYDAATGKARWSRPVGEQSTQMETVERSGVLLLAGGQETVETDMGDGSVAVETYGGTITAVDAISGTTLWTRSGGYHLHAGPETTLLVEHGKQGDPVRFRLVRTRDGGVVWERALPRAVDMTVQIDGDEPIRMVTATGDGEITLLDYATGAVQLVRKLPWAERSPVTGSGSSIALTPGLFLENRTTGTDGEITAYRADTLERLWSAKSGDYLWSQDCGPVICLTEENRFRAVDPLTGEHRWTGTGWPIIGLSPGNEFLLLTRSDTAPQPVLAEAATGRTVGKPGRGWVAYWDADEHYVVLLDPLVKDYTRSVVTRFDLVTGRSTLLGTVPLTGNGRCSGTGPILACQNAGRLTVHRIG